MEKKVLFTVNPSRDSETNRLEVYTCVCECVCVFVHISVCAHMCTSEVSAIQMLRREDWERADLF